MSYPIDNLVLTGPTGFTGPTGPAPTSSDFVDLTTNQVISGTKTFNSNPVFQSGGILFNSGSGIATLQHTSLSAPILTLPSSTDTLASLQAIQTFQNKTIVTCSNTQIASFTATTITTSFEHGLVTGDVILFPNIGSLSGLVVMTNYTIETTPSTTEFTLTGISSLSGSVSNAYYILVSRAAANYTSNGGMFRIEDFNNPSSPIVFDTCSATVPTVFRCTASTGANVISFPSFGGTVAMLNNTQSFSGNKTFSGQLIPSRFGQTTAASAGFYRNPSSTAFSGSNDYFFSYFVTPPTTGSTTGSAHTVHIQGQPTGVSTSSSLYIESGNLLLGPTSNIITSNIRPTSGSVVGLYPFIDLAAGTAVLFISPSSGSWTSSGSAEIRLGDVNHYIRAVNSVGITVRTFDTLTLSAGSGIRIGTNGTAVITQRNGSTSYSAPLSSNSTATVSCSFGATFSSTPRVLVSLNGTSGTLWEQCSVQAVNITTTGFDAVIRNNSGSSTSGTVNIVWFAMN